MLQRFRHQDQELRLAVAALRLGRLLHFNLKIRGRVWGVGCREEIFIATFMRFRLMMSNGKTDWGCSRGGDSKRNFPFFGASEAHGRLMGRKRKNPQRLFWWDFGFVG